MHRVRSDRARADQGSHRGPLYRSRAWPASRARALVGALLAAALLAACDTEVKDVPASTQVTLRLDAAPAFRTQLSELRASLWVNGGAGWTHRSGATVRAVGARWPIDIPIVASRREDESAELEVIVEAHGASGLLTQTRVLTRFVAGTRGWVSAVLAPCSSLAPGAVCDDEGCHGAACRACSADGSCVQVAPVLPAEQPGLVDPGAPDAAGPDASADAAPRQDAGSQPMVDGGTPDAAASAEAGAPVDASSTDAGPEPVPDGSTPQACPVPNPCQAPYPCVPTALGYTCRGQFADWPMPDAMLGAKTAPSYASDGITVVDNVTRLQWQLGIPSTYPGCTESSEEGPAGELCQRQQAQAYCADLVHGGYDDWRLPTLIELASLFDTQRESGREAIDYGYFGDTDWWAFITDSTYATGPAFIWGVNFFARATGAYGAYYGKVRCVRAGAEPPFATPLDRYLIDAAADTVTDRATGLIWQRTVMPTKATDTEVEARCSGGFRLPTTNELLSLVDPTRAEPAIDPTAFPNTPSDVFWVSLRAASRNGVDFRTGELVPWIDPSAYVRCVR